MLAHQNNSLGINPLYLPVINPKLKHEANTGIDLIIESKTNQFKDPGFINLYQKYQLPRHLVRGLLENNQPRGFNPLNRGFLL